MRVVCFSPHMLFFMSNRMALKHSMNFKMYIVALATDCSNLKPVHYLSTVALSEHSPRFSGQLLDGGSAADARTCFGIFLVVRF